MLPERYARDDSDSPFGIKTSRFPRSFAVLDKSFLDAIASPQLQLHAQNGWTFGIPEALMYELMRKRDEWRTKNLLKLCRIQESLVRIPGIGEMFRAEARLLKPAPSVLKAHRVEFTLNRSTSGELFSMTPAEMRATEERTEQLKRTLPDLIGVWRSLGSMPELKDARPDEIPERLADLSRQIRDDREAMRQFYANHRRDTFPSPSPELIDEQWAFFRWIQVYLIAGLDFFHSYGL